MNRPTQPSVACEKSENIFQDQVDIWHAGRFIFREKKIQFRHGALPAKNIEEVERGGWSLFYGEGGGLAPKEEKRAQNKE